MSTLSNLFALCTMVALVFWNSRQPLPEPQNEQKNTSLELQHIQLKLTSNSGSEVDISGSKAKLSLNNATEIEFSEHIHIQRGETSLQPKRVFVDLEKNSLKMLDLHSKGPPTLSCAKIELSNEPSPITIMKPHFGGLIPMASDADIKLMEAAALKGTFDTLDSPFIKHESRRSPEKPTATKHGTKDNEGQHREQAFSLSSAKGTLLITRVGVRLSLEQPLFCFKDTTIQAKQARIRSGQQRLIFSQSVILRQARTETHLDHCEIDLATATVTSMDQQWRLLGP